MVILDEHGQPINRRYSNKRLNDRMIDELVGVSRGIIADQMVNKAEAEFLHSWLKQNYHYCSDPVINRLYLRVHEMLADGELDDQEEKELIEILRAFSGEKFASQHDNLSCTLPLCAPAPIISFENKTFCFTGKFAYGPRRVCNEVVIERGGRTSGKVTMKTDYLVIGTFCSTDWIHTAYGRKIEAAAEYRDTNGLALAIISEDHWAHSAFS